MEFFVIFSVIISPVSSIEFPKSSISSQNLCVKDLWDRDGRWMKEKFTNSLMIPEIKIYILRNKIEDKKVWTFAKSGLPSIKSAYNIKSYPLLKMP